MELDLVIRGGTVVTAADVGRSDIGVKDGRIVALAEDLPRAASEIDASGLLVLPGGIDSHVHLAQPMAPGIVMADGFESGTRSAAAGGNTTVISFALQPRGASLRQSVEDYHMKARGQSYVDYGFHLIVTDPTPAVLGQELPALVSSGYPSFKVFMTYDDLVLTDRQLLEVFTVAREQGALVMVHAEGYDQIKFMTDRLEREGKTQPYFHAASRPELVEREATHRAISHAELIGIPIMIVHVSGREAMEQIQWARGRGLKIYAETCPQYLVLTAEDLKGLNMDMSGRQIRLLAAAARPRLARGDLARARGRRVPDFLLGPLPVSIRRRRGQDRSEGADLVPLGAERHSGHRRAAADPVLGGRLEGAHLAAGIRRADRDQPRQDVWPLSAQRLDHDRRRRRHRDLGRRQESEADPGSHAARQRLHALRRLRSDGMAGQDAGPGRARRRRRPHRRRAGIRPIPAAGDSPAA